MKVEVRGSTVPLSDALEEHILRRLDFALRRFGERVDRIVVRLVDLNGPEKGGLDKRCRLETHLMRSAPSMIVVGATGADPYTAVNQAAARLEERVARTLSKQRTWATSARHHQQPAARR